MAEIWRVGADRNLRVVYTDSWDGDAARDEIFAWAGWPDHPDPAKARRAFLVYDEANAKEKGAYKLPFARPVDGVLFADSSGVRAAAQRLPQADLPMRVKARARRVIELYLARIEAGRVGKSVETPEDLAAVVRKELVEALDELFYRLDRIEDRMRVNGKK